MNKKQFTGKAPVITMITLFTILALFTNSGCGSMLLSEDLEKPKPETSRDGNRLIAKLIPRGKNNSVEISFEPHAGELIDLKGIDFDTAPHPLVDKKDFRSSLFELKIGKLSPGQEVEITIGSEFFTTATEYWIYNQHNKPPWVSTNAQSIAKTQIYVDLILRVKDGGRLDLDGLENGEITLVGGPRDSFWGYALGTLFIRFFGVFIVLIALMICMICFGKLSKHLRSKKQQKITPSDTPHTKPDPSKSDDRQPPISPELFAAIALVIELETQSTHSSNIRTTKTMHPESRLWAQQGRTILMDERSSVYTRVKR